MIVDDHYYVIISNKQVLKNAQSILHEFVAGDEYIISKEDFQKITRPLAELLDKYFEYIDKGEC